MGRSPQCRALACTSGLLGSLLDRASADLPGRRKSVKGGVSLDGRPEVWQHGVARSRGEPPHISSLRGRAGVWGSAPGSSRQDPPGAPRTAAGGWRSDRGEPPVWPMGWPGLAGNRMTGARRPPQPHTGGVETRADRLAKHLANPTSNPAHLDARRIMRQTTDPDPRAALQTMAQRLGHGQLAVEQTASGARWFSWCICGWVSTTKGSEKDASGAALHHVRKELRRWTTAAVPLEAMPPAPETNWARVAQLHPHWAAKRAQDCPEYDTPIHLPGFVRATG